MGEAPTLHASCVVVRDAAILIRGPSGSGKSQLARDLIFEAERLGRFARLLGDDRVRVAAHHGRLVAAAVPSIAGKLEARGFGVLTLPHEPAAVVRLVIDCLAEDADRLPAPADRTVTLAGVPLARIGARVSPGLARMVLLRLDQPGDTLMTL